MQHLRRPAAALAVVAVLSLAALFLTGPGIIQRLLHQPEARQNDGGQPTEPSALLPPPPVRPPELQRLIDQYNTPELLAAFRTSLSWRLPGEAENLAVAARLLKGTVLQPGETFSQNARLGPYTKKRGYGLGPMYVGNKIVKAEGGGVCQMATTLFNVVVLADLEIISRRPHSMTVPYVPPGQDATVATGKCDFIFRNNSQDPILIWAEVIGDYEWLSVEFYSRHKAPQVVWHHQELKRYPYSTRYIPDQELPAGVEEEVIPGADGVTVKTWVEVTYPDGTTRIRNFGTHTYVPCPRVMRRGTKS